MPSLFHVIFGNNYLILEPKGDLQKIACPLDSSLSF